MAKQKVAILGCTGMLGSMTLDSFVKSSGFDVTATYRSQSDTKLLKNRYPKVRFCKFGTEKNSLKSIVNAIAGVDWVVNAIGVIKPYIRDDNGEEVRRAVNVNAHFPHLLAQAAEITNSNIIQIATDCVYSGQKGRYVETDTHDALDVYGKTKSLGEVFHDKIQHLRCSIIGPEPKARKSLLEWFLGQPKEARINGFTNHHWNGVTTLHFARLCQGIIKKRIPLPHIQHIVPHNSVSKADLLKSFAKKYNRDDIIISDVKAPAVVDRTLVTNNQKLNNIIWVAAGYDKPPTIEQMVAELAKYSSLGQGVK